MGVSGQRHAPAALYPRRKDPRYPLNRRLGGPQSRSGRRGQKKSPLPLSGIDRPIVQLVVGHYTAWATAAQYTLHAHTMSVLYFAIYYSPTILLLRRLTSSFIFSPFSTIFHFVSKFFNNAQPPFTACSCTHSNTGPVARNSFHSWYTVIK
jgi:hypothetical protein